MHISMQVLGETRVSTFLDPAHLRQVEALAHSAQLGIAEQLQVPLTTEFQVSKQDKHIPVVEHVLHFS